MTDLISWRAWSAEHALPSETPLHTSDDVGRSWYYRHRLWAPTSATIGLNPNMW